MAEVSLADIERARTAITPYTRHTPLIPAPSLSDGDRQVFFKLEILQDTGTFKLRGATNAILNLTPEERARGVVAVSEEDHLIATIGLSDLVIVHSPDATLVCKKRDAPGLKELVEKLRETYGERYL